jgi:hypothetical protein
MTWLGDEARLVGEHIGQRPLGAGAVSLGGVDGCARKNRPYRGSAIGDGYKVGYKSPPRRPARKRGPAHAALSQ